MQEEEKLGKANEIGNGILTKSGQECSLIKIGKNKVYLFAFFFETLDKGYHGL